MSQPISNIGFAPPITNICVVSKKTNCPPSYELLDATANGDTADLWKDSLFKGKVKRYLCFSRAKLPNQDIVITDIALVGLKDAVPNGYTAVRNTVDSQEQAFQKHILCVRFVLRAGTASAITDIRLCKDDSYREAMYTLSGEMNGIKITFKLAPVQQPARPAPPTPPSPTLVHDRPQRAPVPARHNPPPPVPSKQTSTGGFSAFNAIEGIPFQLNEKLVISGSLLAAPTNVPDITSTPLADLISKTEYDFSKERSIVNHAP